jgi:large repetitive protein
MTLSRQIWEWLHERRPRPSFNDPLAPFATLTVRQLEERRVLSVSVGISGGDVTVDVVGDDTVTFEIVGTDLVITDVNNVVIDTIAVGTINTLTVNADEGDQTVQFIGGNPFVIPTLTINSTDLNGATGTDQVIFQHDFAAADGVAIDVTGSVTVGMNWALTSADDSIVISAGGDVLLAAGSSLTADGGIAVTAGGELFMDLGSSLTATNLDISLSAGTNLTAQELQAGGDIDLTAGGGVFVEATVTAVNGGVTIDGVTVELSASIEAQTGVSITADDGVSIAAGGDITVHGGNLTIDAGADATDHLTIDGSVTFDVSSGTAASVSLTAGGNVSTGVITGTNLADVSLTATAGSIALDGAITADSITLQAATGITDGATAVITASTLELLGAGDATLDNGHLIDVLAADLDGSLTFVNGQTFSVGLAGATTGITLGPSANRNLSLTATGGSISLDADVSTTGSQSYLDDVLLLTDVLLTSSAGGVSFAGTVDATASENFIIEAGTGDVLFQGAVGSLGALGTLSVEAAGQITAAGTLNATGDIALTSSAGGIALQAAVTSTGGDVTLDHAGLLSIEGDMTAAGAFVELGGGDVDLCADIAADAGISFQGNVILTTNVTLTTVAGDVTFDGTVETDGTAWNLSIASTSGHVTLHDTVGVLNPLGDVQIDTAGNVALNAAFVVVGSLDITGHDVTLVDVDTSAAAVGDLTVMHTGTLSLGNVALAGSFLEDGTGDVLFDGSVITSTGDVTFNTAVGVVNGSVQTGSGNVTFGSSVDGAGTGSEMLSISSATGDLQFQGSIGSSQALQGLTTDTAGTTSFLGPVDVNGTLAVNQTVVTPGAVDFQGAVTTSGDLLVEGSSITAASTLAAGGTLVLHADQNVALSGDATAVGTVLITSDNATVQTENVTSQTDAVSIAAALTVTVTGSVNAATTADLSSTLASVEVTGQIVAGDLLTVAAATDVTVGEVAGVSLQAGTVNIETDAAGGGVVDIAGSITSTTGGVSLLADAGLLVGGSVLAATSVVLESRTQNVNVAGAVTATLASVEIAAADGIDITGDIEAGTLIDIETTTGDVQLGGHVSAQDGDVFIESAGGNVEVLGTLSAGTTLAATASIEILAAGTVDLHGEITAEDHVLIDNGGLLTLHQGANVEAGGMFVQTGTGNVDLGADITTGDSVQFASPVRLTADVTITSATGGVVFSGTVDADGTNMGGESLTIDAGNGDVSFGDAVGGTTALEFLTVTTSGAIDALGNITAEGDVSLASTGDDIVLLGAVHSSTGGVSLSGELGVAVDLNVSAATGIVVQSASGGAAFGGDLTATAGGVSFDVNGTVAVSGSVVADGPVLATVGALDVDGEMASVNGGIDLTAQGDIDVGQIGGMSLSAGTSISVLSQTGSVTLAGSAAAGDTLGIVADGNLDLGGDVEAGSAILLSAGHNGNPGTLTVTGNIESTGAEVVLFADTTLDVTGNITAVTFAGLSTNTGTVTVVGDIAAGAALTVDAGSAVDITGGLSAGTTLTVTAETDLTVTGDVTAVDALSLTATNGGIDIGGSVTSSDQSVVMAAETSVHVAGAVAANTFVDIEAATGAVDLDQAVTATTGRIDIAAATDLTIMGAVLAGDAVDLETGTGAIDLQSSVTAQTGDVFVRAGTSLTVAGAVTAEGSVVLESKLQAAAVTLHDAVTATTGDVTLSGQTLAASGAITAGNAVVIDTVNGTVLNAAAEVCAGAGGISVTGDLETAANLLADGGPIVIDGGLSLSANVLIDSDRFETGGAHVTITGTVDIAAFTLTLDAGTAGDIDLQQALTGTGDLGVEQGNHQSYNALTLNNLMIEDATSSVTFTGAVIATGDVEVCSQGTVTLQSTLVAGGTVLLKADGGTMLCNDLMVGDITFDTAVVLCGDVMITATGAVVFGDTVNSETGTDWSLTVDTAGLTEFQGEVGGIDDLGQLTTTGGGTTVLHADVTTAGEQQYGDAVELAGNVILAATDTDLDGEGVEFGDTVTGHGFDLTIVGGGAFAAAVSGLDVFVTDRIDTESTFAATEVTVTGTAELGGHVNTTGGQSYAGAVTLTADVTLSDSGSGDVIFGSTVDSDAAVTPRALTVTTAGVTTFGDDVGGTFALRTLTTSGGGVTELGGHVSTTETQQYDDAVELTADVVLSSSGAGALGDITFAATVDGPHSLTVNTAGTTQFDGRVGDAAALTELHTDAAGTTVLNTDVVTAGVVQFDDPVLIDTTTTVTGTTSVGFGSSVMGVDGIENLTVVSGGAATFSGSVSNLTDLTVHAAGTTLFGDDVTISGALTTDAAGLTKIDAAVITASTVEFQDAVELCQDLAITADEITFGSTLDEAAGAAGSDLTLTATGDIAFSDAVGGTTALDSLTITTADDVTFTGSIQLIGDLEQQAGTGTTAFHGTSGAGIGGELLVTTDTVTFSTADVVTVGAVVIAAQNAILFHANAGLNAGGSTITLRANQDGVGAEGLTQADGTVIQTTNDTTDALLIEVGGTGDAALSDVRAGTTGGVVTVTAGGVITDNSVGESANITAFGAALTATTGIGGAGAADLNTAVSRLEAVTTTGGITLHEADDVTIGGVTGALGGLDVLTAGDIHLTAGGSITVSEQITGPDDITLLAVGAASDLTIEQNSGVESTDGDILLSADRTVTISEDVGTTGAGTITVTGNSGSGARNIVVDAGAVVSVVDGDLTLDADRGAQQTGDFAGVLIDNATLRTTGAGDIVITGHGGDDLGGGQHGVAVVNGGAIAATGSGDITITGRAGVGTGLGIDLAGAGTATLTTAAGTGDIRLIADSMSFAAGTTIDAGGNVVTLVQSTAGVQIDLGGTDSVGVLGLTDAELDTITAGELHIGDANSGDITFSADVDLTNNTTVLCLQTASTVTATAGGIQVQDLAVTAGGAVTMTDASLDVDNVAITTTSGNITFLDADGFTVTTVCGVDGVSTLSGSVALTATTGNITIANTAAAADVSATAGITIALLANDALFTIAAGANVQTSAGGVLVSADKMDLGGSITAAGQRVTLKNSVGADAILLGNVGDGTADALELSDAELDRITCGTLEIGSATMGAITVTDDLFLTNNATVLHLVSGSTVTATAGGVVVNNLAITADGGVTFTDSTTNVFNLAIDTSTGDVLFTEASGLAVTTVDGVAGIDTDNGSITLIVTVGDLVIANTAAANDLDATTGITLTLLAVDAQVTLNTGSNMQTAAGGVTISADRMALGGSITAVGQTVTLVQRTDGVQINLGGADAAGVLGLTDAELDRITAAALHIGNAQSGGITVSADLFLTNNADLLRLETAAGVTATAGGVVVSNLAILAGGTVNFTDATTDVDTLAVVTTAGSVTFTDSDDLTLGTVAGVAGITTAGGDVTLTTNGQLTLGTGLGEDLTALGATVCVMTGVGGMTQQAGSVITASDLYLTGAGIFTLTEANDVNVLAAQLTGAGSSLHFNDVDELTIGTVCGFAGVSTNSGNVTLTTGSLITIGDGSGQDISAGNAVVTLDTASGGVLEQAGSAITASGLRLLGTGVYTLNQQNDVTTFAADVDGTIAYTDANALVVGTVAGTVGITTADDDVKLTTGGSLTITDDISLGVADLTLNVTGAVTQTAGDVIIARGLLLLGTGTVTLNEANDVDVLAASYNGTIVFTDIDDLTIGTVTDDPSGMTASGITTSSDDVKLTTGGDLTITDDVTLGVADLTLNVTGAVTQTAGDVIIARGLQLLGTGTVTLDDANDVDVLAASYDGTISFNDIDELTIGTVTDEPSGMATAGITTSDDNVTLTAGGLITIGTGAGQDIVVGSATVTLNAASGGVLENAGSVIVADQLLLTGTGTFTLAQGNDVNTLAADIAGSLTFVDVDDLVIGTVAAVNGIRTGDPTVGGDVTITAGGDLTVDQAISTQGGAGGAVTVTGGTLNAALIVGGGNITLTGGNEDLVINVDQTSATTLTYQANRDVIINAVVTTTGAGADVLVTADLDDDGSGGVQVTATGQVVSTDAIVLTGSDLFATAGSLDSVRIDADGANDQLLAVGNITLQSGAAAPAGADIVIDGRVHSTGGDIVVNATDTIHAQSVIAADNGSVIFQDAVVLTGDLQVTAGDAATFQSTVNDDGLGGTTSHLTVTAAGATTFQSHIGNLAAISSLTSDGGDVTNLCGNVTTVNGQTYADAVVLCADTITLTSTAAGTITFQSTVDSDAVGPRNLVVNTAGVTDFQGAIGGTRALATLTTDAPGSTQIGGGLVRTTGQQTYNDNVLLTNHALLESVAASADGADIIFAGTVQTGGFNLTFDAGTQGDLTLLGATTGGGTLTVLRGDVQQFAAVTVDEFVIQSATTSITFHDAVNVTNNVSIASSGTITQESIVDAGTDITYTAIGLITIQDAMTAGSDVTLTSTAGAIASSGAITATNGDLTITAADTFTATGALTAATSVVLTTTNGTVLSATADVCTTAAGGIVTITGPLTTAADILTNDGAITLTGPVLLIGNVTWDSDRFETGGADILVQGTVATGGFNLTVDAGAMGDLTFLSTLTGGGDLTVEDGAVQRFEAAVQVTNLTILDATTSITFVAPVSITNDVSVASGGSVTLQDTLTAGNDISITAGTTLSAAQMLTAGDQLSLTAGTVMTLAETADLMAGAGGVILTAPQILTAAEITTAGGDVAITGAVTLTGDVTIDTGGTGNVLVTGTINAQAAFVQSLFLTTGTGDITVTGDVGTTTALNNLVISDANDVTFGGGITADTLLQQSGLGTTTIVGAVNTFGAGGIQLTTTSIQFAAGTSSMDSHGQIIVLTADAITLPTTFTNALGSTVTLQTLSAGTSIGLEDATQDLNFTDAQLDTIHAANLVIGSATQTAGISVGGGVSLDENLTLLTAGTISVSGALSATTANTILLDAGNVISVTGSVSVLSGNLTLQADDDLTFGAAALVQSVSGNVLLLADADGDANGSGGGITMADGAVVNSGSGTLTLLADEDIVIGRLISSNATADAIRITTLSGGVIDGGDTGGADIVVTNGTGVVTINAVTGVGSAAGGGADAAIETQVNQLAIVNTTSGAVNIDEVDAITILGVEQLGPGSVTLTAGGTMTVAAGGPGVQTQGGDITLVTTGAASNLVLLAAVESRGGDVTLTVSGDLAQSVTAPIASSGGDLTVTVGSDATFAGAVSTSGGDFSATVGGNFAQAGTAPISTAGGHLTASVGGNASFAALVNTAGGDVTLAIGGNTSFTSAGDVVTANGDFSSTVGGSVTMADGAVISTALGTISVVAGGDVTLGQLVTSNGTASAVLVRSTGGQIIDGGDAGGADIVANAAGAVVTLEARNGIGSTGAGGAIDTQIDTLVLRNTATGNVAINEADALRILELTQSAAGSVTVTTVGSLLLVGGNPGVTATTGTVTLAATGAASNVTIDSKVQTASGQIIINAANNVTLGAVAQITSTSGSVTITADADGNANGVGGSLFMANGAVINAGSGDVTLRADGNITVGRVVTTSTATLISTSGGVVDGGDTGGADIVANAVVFQTRTGIGSANALETSVNTLAAVNTDAGAIRIDNNTGGLLTIGTVGGVTGITNSGGAAAVVSVVNNGGITVNGAVRNNTGGDVVLTANNAGDLTVNAVIAAANGHGDVLLTAADDLILNDTGAAVDISVQNGGEVVGVAGGNVVFGDNFVVQSSTGQVSGIPPVLIDVMTPQITALGEATLTFTTQRPLEVGTVIVIDWGDGTTETFVVTEPGTQTLTFTHIYTGPPDPANPAADIPISVTVLAPGFTTGATVSPTDGTVQVDNGSYVSNIRFAAGGEVLAPNDGQIGTLNQTLFTGVFKTPGEGLASFVFDLTPEVPVLEFPQGSKLDASLLAVPQPPEQTNLLGDLVTDADELQAEDRVVVLEVIGPDGTVLQRVVLSEDVLDDIDGVIRKLPDGRYRFSLREPGETQLRLLQDVEVRQGRISDDRDATRDRPPTLPAAPNLPMPAPDLDAAPPTDALQPDNAAADDGSDAEPVAAWSSWRAKRAWRQALAEAGEDADQFAREELTSSTEVAPVIAAAGVAPAVLTRPVRTGFHRAARLLRKYGVG